MSGEDPRLASLRDSLLQAESDLRNLGYEVERIVLSPGVRVSNQILDEDLVILVLFGKIGVRSGETQVEVGAGDRIDVPSGVPHLIEVLGETSAYLLQASRKTRPQRPQEPGAGNDAGRLSPDR